LESKSAYIACGPEDRISNWPYLTSLGKPSEPSSDETFKFIEDQIEECVKNHRKCGRKTAGALPKRVLDVGSDENDVVKLYISKNEHEKYAALSHRWCKPGKTMLTTTTATVSKYLEGVGWDDLPKTIQDAIKVCRRLRIRYLWVDTLCLVQDGDGDEHKEMEIQKMAAYYANAFVTIAASSSKDTTASFLQDRTQHYQAAELEFGEERSVIHVRRFGAVGFLANRGWTWQESALSTRILNFAPSELIWECKTELKSISGYEPRYIPSLGMSQRLESAARHPLDRWRQLVQSYTTRELTHEEDIIPAIGGLAQMVYEVTKSQYLAGLWRLDLPWGLLWEVTPGVSDSFPTTVPEHYTSPSWSWASIKGPVRTCDYLLDPPVIPVKSKSQRNDNSFSTLTPAVQVFAAECTVPARSQNPFGKVTDGFITLNGLLTWAALTCDYNNIARTWTSWLHHTTRPDLVETISPDTILEEFDLRPRLVGMPARTARRAKSGPQKKIFRVPVLCLLIGMGQGSKPGEVFYEGILLARSEVCEGAYTRIGFFSFSNGVWFTSAACFAVKIV
jgi:hypothetical protein